MRRMRMGSWKRTEDDDKSNPWQCRRDHVAPLIEDGRTTDHQEEHRHG